MLFDDDEINNVFYFHLMTKFTITSDIIEGIEICYMSRLDLRICLDLRLWRKHRAPWACRNILVPSSKLPGTKSSCYIWWKSTFSQASLLSSWKQWCCLSPHLMKPHQSKKNIMSGLSEDVHTWVLLTPRLCVESINRNIHVKTP